MQALKQAAREGDTARLETLCEEWSVPAAQTDQSTVHVPAADNPPRSVEPARTTEQSTSEPTVRVGHVDESPHR